ncbi:5-oxoprolinase subunit PxpB [Deinococcus sonorensis]|uniref:5-oxoprolinase subunit PxpB n=2 Tax=Deinococcus sonorensis TaxID=309891 RepID=A0AAU7UDQ5_9DEIO
MHPAVLYRRLAPLTPASNARLHRWAAALLTQALPGLLDVVPAYSSLYVEYDEQQVPESEVAAWVDRLCPEEQQAQAGRTMQLPVCYDGPDLDEVAARLGLSVPELVRQHSAVPYRVYALGFVAGFPFMGEVPPALQLPRRSVPRARVPAHSVAMAAAQSGLYPVASPGGWHLLGRALEAAFDPRRPEPFLLQPGDTVQFVPTPGESPPDLVPLSLLPQSPQRPLLRVERPGALDLLMDRGRFLQGRYGLVRSGALDALAADVANRLLGNPPDAPVLELHLSGPQLTVLADAVLSVTGAGLVALVDGEPQPTWSSFAVHAGQTLRFRPDGRGRVSYLALPGGLQAEPFRGSVSTDLKAGVGRPLQAGDVLGAAGAHRPLAGRRSHPRLTTGPIRLLPLDDDPAALEALCSAPFRVLDADRMGVRLDGPAVPGGEVRSEASPIGTVQVPPSGQPIVLLNDKGTLGGYRKPARVWPPDLPRLAQVRPGEWVRFRRA